MASRHGELRARRIALTARSRGRKQDRGYRSPERNAVSLQRAEAPEHPVKVYRPARGTRQVLRGTRREYVLNFRHYRNRKAHFTPPEW